MVTISSGIELSVKLQQAGFPFRSSEMHVDFSNIKSSVLKIVGFKEVTE